MKPMVVPLNNPRAHTLQLQASSAKGPPSPIQLQQ
jgi:hypothetical protein